MNEAPKREWNPIMWIRQHFQKPTEVVSQQNSTPLPDNYLVNKRKEGVYIDWSRGEELQARYFQTVNGQWYLLANSGPWAPFDEDAEINPQGEMAQYLSKLIETIKD